MSTKTLTINQAAPSTTLKSYDGGSQGFTTIINNLSYAIKLYWVDRSGVEQAYETVNSGGQDVRQSAYAGHAWRIKDLNGNFVAEFYGDTQQLTLNATGNQFTFDDSNLNMPTTLPSAVDYIHQTYGYGIINVAKALGVSYTEAPFTGSRMLSYDNSAALKYIDAYGLWKQGFDGKGITVAIIGTGIDMNNVEFSGRIINGYDFGSNDSDSSPDPTDPKANHETGIAGILAGSAVNSTGVGTGNVIGVAPNATILNIKDSDASGNINMEVTLSQSIRYAVDQGAKVISISQGNSGNYFNPELYAAAKYAQDHNVLICIAAGNDYKVGLGMPAFSWIGLNNFIVVGNWNMAQYNLFASSTKPGTSDVPYVIAPSSEWTTSLNNTYAYYEDGGTSYATPYVSGLAALLFQEHPSWTVSQVIQQITSTATLPYSTSTSLSTNAVTLPANSIYNASPNQTITGTMGVNKVVFTEPASNFRVSISGTTVTLVDTIGTFGTETLNNVQRVQFNDGTALALDFLPAQNGYLTAMLIGTAFGASLVPSYFATRVALYDSGQTNLQITTVIEQLGLIESQIGSTSNKAWVDFVYKNVMGVAPDSVSEATFVNNLNNGIYTKATLLALAVDFADSGGGTLATQINLIGLQSHGLSYQSILS